MMTERVYLRRLGAPVLETSAVNTEIGVRGTYLHTCDHCDGVF